MKPASQLDLEKEALGCGILVIEGFFTLVGGVGAYWYLTEQFQSPLPPDLGKFVFLGAMMCSIPGGVIAVLFTHSYPHIARKMFLPIVKLHHRTKLFSFVVSALFLSSYL